MHYVTVDDSQPKRTGPERTCVGCRAHDARGSLVRFAFDGTRLVPDARARLGGRGVWVHASRRCVTKAVKGGGFARVLRSTVPFEVRDVAAMLVVEFESRIAGLLGGARRARHAVHGTDECRNAIGGGSAYLAVVAADAKSSNDSVVDAARRADVPVLELGSKAWLGRLFGKEETGAVVVTDPGLASSISQVATTIAALSEGE